MTKSEKLNPPALFVDCSPAPRMAILHEQYRGIQELLHHPHSGCRVPRAASVHRSGKPRTILRALLVTCREMCRPERRGDVSHFLPPIAITCEYVRTYIIPPLIRSEEH